MGSSVCTFPASGSQCNSNIEIPLFAIAEVNEHILMVTPPPITMQPIIDKTASYVARKGQHSNDRDVVAVLRKHDPQRFAFLNPDNEYNAFYRYKVGASELHIPIPME